MDNSKKSTQGSRGGRSKNKLAMTASAASDQDEFSEKFEMLAIRDDGGRKKNQEEALSGVEKPGKQSKKSPRGNRGKKKGNSKNVLGVKPPAVVVELSEATVAVAPLNQKNGVGGKKKNLNRKQAVADIENVPDNMHYGGYDDVYDPGHYYYHDPGYYYQDSGYYPYYCNYDYSYNYSYNYPVHDNMAYHQQYSHMPMAMPMADHHSPQMNIDAPAFEPTDHQQH